MTLLAKIFGSLECKKAHNSMQDQAKKGWCVRLSCSEQSAGRSSGSAGTHQGAFGTLSAQPSLQLVSECCFSEQKCCPASLQERRGGISQLLLCIHGQGWCWKFLAPSEYSQCLYSCLSTILDTAPPDLCSPSCPAHWDKTLHKLLGGVMVLTSKSAIWKKKIHKTKDPMKQPPHADSTKLPECERMPRSLSVPSQHGILNAKLSAGSSHGTMPISAP